MRNKQRSWIRDKWRPAMGWMYFSICLFDFIIFPISWGYAHIYTQSSLVQWNPITLQGSGLFHVAMGAILGVTAWGRTQEKISGVVYDKYVENSENENQTNN